MRVLLVEDDNELRPLIGAMLESKDVEVVSAEFAAEALTLFAEDSQGFDAVVIDYMLDGSVLNGAVLAKVLSISNNNVVIITAAPRLLAQDPESVGMTILPKPFTADDLMGVISRGPG